MADQELEEGSSLRLDFKKLRKIASGAADVIPAVATQCAGLAVEKATDAANKQETQKATLILKEALTKLESLGNVAKAADGIQALRSLLSIIEEYGTLDPRAAKSAKFRSSHMRKMKSMAAWTLDEEAPSYSMMKITPQNNSDDTSKS